MLREFIGTKDEWKDALSRLPGLILGGVIGLAIIHAGERSVSNAHVVTTAPTAIVEQVKPAIVTDHSVRPTEIDQKGHVNNARYVEWLQWGRWEYLRAAKLPDSTLRGMGAIPVVVRVEVDYLAEVHEGDAVKILTRPGTAGGKSFRFEQTVVRSDGTEVAKAIVVMVCVDPTTRKAVAPPNELRRLFEDERP